MKKQYLIIFTLVFGLLTYNGFSQNNDLVLNEPSDIENLTIYSNQVSHGKVYITARNNDPNHIEIYNVLGKSILTVTLLQKELKVSRLKAGVYIIKVTENNTSSTENPVVR